MIGKDCNVRLIDFGTSKPINPEKIYNQSEIEFIKKLRNEGSDGSEGEEGESMSEEEVIMRNKSFVGSAAYLSP